MEKVYDVIIIGAGISGIGASLNLSKSGIEHIILQARDRIGGRVAAKDLDGLSVQLGAGFVHSPHRSNRIVDIMKEINWQATPTSRSSQQYLYQDRGEISEEISNELCTHFQKLNNGIEKAIDSKQDCSIAEATQIFFDDFQGKEELLQLLKWKLKHFAGVEGGYLTELSAKDYVQGDEDWSEADLMPNQGYSKLVEKIYNIHKKEIRFNERVVKIDYSSKDIKIHTKDNIYQARRVISSLPLGILQSGQVQFSPQLPESHQKVIHKIGNGIANKLIISFQKPFWDETKHYINFITKQQGRYLAARVLKQGKALILSVYLSKTASLQLDVLSDEEVVKDFVDYLSKFNLKTEVKVRAYEVTRWHKDPFALGSYSFVKVGTTPEDFKTIRSPINDRLWFIGQHCHPTLNSVTHAAFQTGLWAAQEVQKNLKQ